jgi:hypothetical protein
MLPEKSDLYNYIVEDDEKMEELDDLDIGCDDIWDQLGWFLGIFTGRVVTDFKFDKLYRYYDYAKKLMEDACKYGSTIDDLIDQIEKGVVRSATLTESYTPRPQRGTTSWTVNPPRTDRLYGDVYIVSSMDEIDWLEKVDFFTSAYVYVAYRGGTTGLEIKIYSGEKMKVESFNYRDIETGRMERIDFHGKKVIFNAL